jgi:hypothetical protein
MKFSLSIGGQMYERFSELARRVAGGNLSLLAAVAIKELLKRKPSEVADLVAQQRHDRQAPTRSAWMRAYWDALGVLMGRPDASIIDSPYSPRQFDGLFAVLLLNHVGRDDDENDPFFPHIGPLPVMPGSPQPFTWTFPRDTTPLAAAEVVAAKLRDYGVSIQNERKVTARG